MCVCLDGKRVHEIKSEKNKCQQREMEWNDTQKLDQHNRIHKEDVLDIRDATVYSNKYSALAHDMIKLW